MFVCVFIPLIESAKYRQHDSVAAVGDADIKSFGSLAGLYGLKCRSSSKTDGTNSE